MHWPTYPKRSALGLLSAACFVACSDGAAPSTSASDSAVSAAYAALLSDVASCAKQVKTCVDAAGSDEAALATCRDDFASCRDAAGKSHVNALAGAVRSCTSTHNSCVRSAKHGAAGSCQSELRSCLGAAHTDNTPRDSDHDDNDDDDAGTDERKSARADCLDELHPCVQADGPANRCAEQVRMCVVDSVPSASDVVPGSDSDDSSDDTADSDDDDSEDDLGMGAGKPGDAGVGHGKSGSSASSKADTAADAGAHGKGQRKDKLNPARMCVDSFRGCLDAGSAARSCAQTLKECRAAATL